MSYKVKRLSLSQVSELYRLMGFLCADVPSMLLHREHIKMTE